MCLHKPRVLNSAWKILKIHMVSADHICYRHLQCFLLRYRNTLQGCSVMGSEWNTIECHNIWFVLKVALAILRSIQEDISLINTESRIESRRLSNFVHLFSALLSCVLDRGRFLTFMKPILFFVKEYHFYLWTNFFQFVSWNLAVCLLHLYVPLLSELLWH